MSRLPPLENSRRKLESNLSQKAGFVKQFC